MTIAPTRATPPPVRRVGAALPWLTTPADAPPGSALHATSPAFVLADGRVVTRGELDGLLDDAGAALSGTRRLVLVAMANRLEAVVGYLAALRAGHAVLLVDASNDGALRSLREAYDPDVEVGADGRVVVHRDEPAVELHPDLALLLSTSGSTGSPKLVRLSWQNLAANAAQIADYLGLRPTDRAITSLPLHYCYGLSVLHSHLSVGASVVLTDLSVVDDCFWELASRAGATSFAGVPWTFEMLERSGFAARDLPSLRHVTQAGGRLDPERVVRWSRLGQARGWDLYVMYGQTEATARMAYLPPDLAAGRPTAIGRPVAGGGLDIEDGELVYSGPNVMLGYATSPADLALGRTVERLRTGDLGRLAADGLYEVTGRVSRHVKVLGHRIDLDRVESALRSRGRDVRVAGREGLVAVTVRADTGGRPDLGAVRRAVSEAAAVPAAAVGVVEVAEHPVLPTGKVDHPAVVALAAQSRRGVGCSVRHESSPQSGRGAVATMYAALLHRADVPPASTFASLGGDSLSYVEVSLRLEQLLGDLPTGWHVTPVSELERRACEHADRTARGAPAAGTPSATSTRAGLGDVPTGTAARGATATDDPAYGLGRLEGARGRWREARRLRTVETSVWLRAVAILLIVGTHADLFSLQGTAHALLVLVGYNVVRFAFSSPSRRGRLRSLSRGTLRVALPTLAVIVPAHVVWGYYEPRNLVLANWVFGQERLGPPWRFWFVEALVLALVVAMLLTALPAFRRAERRWPFGVPLGLTAVAFLLRLDLFELPVPRMQGSAAVVLFLFFLGWAIARATTRRQQWVVTAVAVGTVGTFSGNPARDALSLAVVLALVWLPTSRVPSVLVPLTQVLAASSLFVYVIHWQVLEHLWGRPLLAFAGSLVVGVGYWLLWTRVAAPALAAAGARAALALAATRAKVTGNRATPVGAAT